MIPKELIERIAAANDIVDVISGYFPLKRAGAAFKAVCPFHREKSPSFTVNPTRQIFKCFGCGAGGGVFKFVELYESIPFPEAVKRLGARVNIPVEDEPLSAEENAKYHLRRRLLALHADAAEWFHVNLLRTKAAQTAREYLKGRGLTVEVAKSWKLGYAPESWDALCHWARSKGYSDEELVSSGLVTLREGEERSRNPHFYDRFRDRLMIPICNVTGEVIAFCGRVLSKEAFGGKYVNSPETPLFTKGNVLFGIQKTMRAITEKNSVVVCEGQIDLITAFEAGVKNVLASQGTAFTKEQARIIRRYAGSTGEVVLCFDSDIAGINAAEKSLEPLLTAGLSIRVAEMPAGEDPDSFIRTQGAEAFVRLIAGARDFFEYRIERFAATPEFATPRGKAAFIDKMAVNAALIADPVLLQTVMNNLSARLEIPAAQFAALVKKAGKARASGWKFQKEAPPSPQEETEARLLPMGNATRLLCQLVLLDAEARQWLLCQPWQMLLEAFPEADLLVKVLSGRYEPGEPASVNAFLAALGPQEQAFLAGLLDIRQLPPEPLHVAADCWRDLERRHLEQQRDVLAARLRKPGLPPEEVIKLQKQVLDLTQQLTHITRPLSPPR